MSKVKQYANIIKREVDGVIFDLGRGATEKVHAPAGTRTGDRKKDSRFSDVLVYKDPTLEIKSDGLTHAEPGEWRDLGGQLVRYDTDRSSVDRRNVIVVQLPDGTVLHTFDHEIPAGAKKLPDQRR